MKSFEKFLQREFDVGELDHCSFHALGCEIDQIQDRSIVVTQMNKYDTMDIDCLRIDRSRNGDSPATPADLHSYKRVLGQMLYVGRTTNPVLQFHASNMACKTADLYVRHLRELHSILSRLLQAAPLLLFWSTPDQGSFTLEGYCDAALRKQISDPCNGRLGFIIFRRNGDTVHPIHWGAHKLRRVARSSATAEILAAAETTDVLLYLQVLLNEFYYKHPAGLTTDSKIVFELATSIREPAESLNKVALAAIREAFHPVHLSSVSWCPGSHHVADSLTKNNKASEKQMMTVLPSGTYPRHNSELLRYSENMEVRDITRNLDIVTNDTIDDYSSSSQFAFLRRQRGVCGMAHDEELSTGEHTGSELSADDDNMATPINGGSSNDLPRGLMNN